MGFNRLHEFERVAHSDLASEVEESLKKHLQENHFSPNSSAYYTDQIKASMDGFSVPPVTGGKKTTVADMVSDLMKRTGLSQYMDEIQASISNENKLPNKQADQVSYINVPEIKECVELYIKQHSAFQFAPVLNKLSAIKEELIKAGKLPKELLNLDMKSDKPLLDFIKAKFANSQIHEDNTMVKDIATPSSLTDDSGISDSAFINNPSS